MNFPETILDRRGNSARLVVVNENQPGVLGELTTLVGKANLNILQTVKTSTSPRGSVETGLLELLGKRSDRIVCRLGRGDIAYNVVDLESVPDSPAAMQDAIAGA